MAPAAPSSQRTTVQQEAKGPEKWGVGSMAMQMEWAKLRAMDYVGKDYRQYQALQKAKMVFDVFHNVPNDRLKNREVAAFAIALAAQNDM